MLKKHLQRNLDCSSHLKSLKEVSDGLMPEDQRYSHVLKDIPRGQGSKLITLDRYPFQEGPSKRNLWVGADQEHWVSIAKDEPN